MMSEPGKCWSSVQRSQLSEGGAELCAASLEGVLGADGLAVPSCCACMSSCLEVQIFQAPCRRACVGSSEGGDAEGTKKGGSGTGAAPPRAMLRCGRHPDAKAAASLRWMRRDASVSFLE